MIQEALDQLTQDEKVIHEKLKDVSDDTFLSYFLKRALYKEPTQEEIAHINNIYEFGSTEFEFKLFNKPHKMKLLSQREKTEISKLIDNSFNASKPEERYKYFSEDQKQEAMNSLKVVATVALATISLENDLVSKTIKDRGAQDTLRERTNLFSEMNNTIIQMLYNKYTEFENRLFTLFDFESVRKNF